MRKIQIKLIFGLILICVGLIWLTEIESEWSCRLLGQELNLPTKEYYGIPCLVQVNGHWIPARNLREDYEK